MRTWLVLTAVSVCLSLAVVGCAKKESNLEQAGREMDATLNQMSRDLDKSFNK